MERNMDKPVYKLKWYKFANNLTEVWDIGKEQLESCKFTDVTLLCGLQYIRAHKLILSASSDFFKHIFEVHALGEDPIITLSGIDINDMNILLQFIYQGQVSLLGSELPNFLQAAETLQIKGLSQIITNFKSKELKNIMTDAQKNRSKTSLCKVSKVRKRNSAVSLKCVTSPSKNTKVQQSGTNDEDIISDDSSLPKIKVESPEIKDIENNEDVQKWNTVDSIKVEPPEIRDIDNSEEIEKWKTVDNPLLQMTKGNDPCALKCQVAEHSLKLQTDESNTIGSVQLSPLRIISHQDEEHIPRPPNAFMIFANEWRRKVAQHYPGENNKEISIRLGQMWKGLAQVEKETYYRASHIADINHREKYPNYYYSPKEARIRKTLRQKKKAFDPAAIMKMTTKKPSTFEK